jgi:transposase
MLTLPQAVKIYVARDVADMRKSFNGLSALVQNALQVDVYCGHLFVFFNKRGDQVRIIFWDRSGFCLLAKRLEKGCFSRPVIDASQTHATMEAAELLLILEGIELQGSKRRKRWEGDDKKA